MKKLKKTSVRPHLDTSHQRKLDGKSRFYLKVRANGIAKLYDITPELYMDKKFWVHEVDVVTKKTRKQMRIAHAKGNPNSRNVENQLAAKVNEISKLIRDFESGGAAVSHDQLAMRWRTASATTLCEFVELRIEEDRKTLTRATIDSHILFLKILSEYDSSVLLQDINSEWLLGYENYLRNEKRNRNGGTKGLSPNTVLLNFAKLKKFLRYAALNEIIARNPMDVFFGDSLTKKRFRKTLPTTNKLTPLEIDILHTAYLQKSLLSHENGASLHSTLQPILTAIYTGLRISDIRQLYDASRVTVEGNRFSLVMKKVKRPLELKISNRLSEIIQVEPNMPLLRGKLLSPTAMNTHLRQILNLLGISKYMTWHDLRRTFATQMQANKVDIKRISELLGHSSVSITEKYIQVRSEDLDAAMDSWDHSDSINRESKQLSKVLDSVAELVKLNPKIVIPEYLSEMLGGRISDNSKIRKVS